MKSEIRPAITILGVSVLLLAASPRVSKAQTIVDPGRRTDWSGVGASIQNRSAVCATISPYNGSAATINSAIQNCPSGQVVQLGVGTFSLSSTIDFNNKDNITLRGSGPLKTTVNFTNYGSCRGPSAVVCFGISQSWDAGSPPHVADWTGGFSKGSRVLTLSSTTGIVPGRRLLLDQLMDTNTDTGTVWVCQTTGVCSSESGSGAGAPNRPQQQWVTVTSVSGSSVTIAAPGVNMPNWRSSQSPRAMWGNDEITGSGIENLTLNMSTADGTEGIVFLNAFDCWVKNVASIKPQRNHVWLWQAANITVRDSYFEEGQTHQSQSYGIEFYQSSTSLVENNIFHKITTPVQVNGSASGSVVAYNYFLDMTYTVSTSYMISSNSLHAAGVDMMLFEGNEGNAFQGDGVHGTHHFITVFRNYYNGWETGKQSQTVPINLFAYSRYMNVIGNVLGRAGYHTQYEWNTSGSNHDLSIFALGDSPGSGVPTDARVKTTLLRWGNYDVVTGTSRFVASEVPSGISPFANSVPTSQTLPVSLYLPGRPAWWSAAAWPAIGPDVTGGPGPGGHAYKIPAHDCYDNTPKTNGILNFDAATCYGTSTTPPPPSAPTSLRIVR
jgi:hypothetical protein